MRWLLVVLLVVSVVPAWGVPVGIEVVDLDGPPLKPGDPVEVVAWFSTVGIPDSWTYPGYDGPTMAPGVLQINQIRSTGGRAFDIVSIDGPGGGPDEVLYTIENQACVVGTAAGYVYEFCSNIVTTDVMAPGWFWQGMPVTDWTFSDNGALLLEYPAVPEGQVPTWVIQAVVR